MEDHFFVAFSSWLASDRVRTSSRGASLKSPKQIIMVEAIYLLRSCKTRPEEMWGGRRRLPLLSQHSPDAVRFGLH